MNHREPPLGQPRFETRRSATSKHLFLFLFAALLSVSIIVLSLALALTVFFGAAASLCAHPPVYSVGAQVKAAICPKESLP